MVSLARAVFDLILPTEKEGSRTVPKAHREDTEFRRLFERAVGNFFATELPRGEGWRVYPGRKFYWPVNNASPKIYEYLPIMETDIILENELENRRVIIDTKFTNILTKSKYGDSHRFKSKNIFQLYSYLRSQERTGDSRSLNSEGMLLYPTIDLDVDEEAEIQGHIVRFCTIDLSAPSYNIVKHLRELPLVSSFRKGTAA